MIVKHYLYLSKLAAQMVTSTPSENLFYHRYELQNQSFYFETAKTWILHAWLIFYKGAQLTNYGVKNIFHENPVKVRSFDVIYKKNLLISRMEQADSRTVRVK